LKKWRREPPKRQTSTTNEISNNIHMITEVMKMSAEVAQESSGAASQMMKMTEDLNGITACFKLTA
jgi:methyl-accepting chemotaxis protein